MKSNVFRPNHNKREPTTNAAPDPHAKFCRRCFQQNGYCPSNGKNYPDKDCSI